MEVKAIGVMNNGKSALKCTSLKDLLVSHFISQQPEKCRPISYFSLYENQLVTLRRLCFPLSVGLLVSRITQKLLNRLPLNWDGGWVTAQNRPH